MPATHVVTINKDVPIYVLKDGVEKQAKILQKREGAYYVHYVDTDKRMDEWVSEELCRHDRETSEPPTKKRRRAARSSSPSSSTHQPESADHDGAATPTEVIMTEEEYDYQQHQKARQQKNFETIIFDTWKIKPWYWSPYPLADMEILQEPVPSTSNDDDSIKAASISRASGRSHVRTSDLLMGSLGKQHSISTLWVCHFCFKYMTDSTVWELHKRDCKMAHPPGRKVYQKGAHTIWEVDGAKEKLYCQNLSLFGKLFIEIKTLFFDTDNFLFYILTDAKSAEDHIIGFFSKEKFSYEGYNLACITTLPQYQRKGYGMLMIEFSYELSRRAGQIGSPERPLSDLGLRSYLTYWISTLIRFFRRVLSVIPPGVNKIKNAGHFPDLSNPSEGNMETNHKKRKKVKGFEAEVAEANIEVSLGYMPRELITDPTFTTNKVYETIPQEDGSAQTHVKAYCSLADIARATYLRIDDVAFALNECGLLNRRLQVQDSSDSVKAESIVITRALVEQVAKERSVKRMFMDLSCVLI